MATRLMFAPPSIWPPDRKKASMRPCPPQSKSSRPPSVKKLCRSLDSSETKGRPPPRWRASSAAVAGIGEEAPTATWRTPSRRRKITEASSSSSRKAAVFASRGLAGEDIAREIALEPVRRCRQRGIFREMRLVALVLAGERQRPGALRRHGDRLDIEGGEDAGGARLAGEEIVVMDALDGDDGLRRGMRHRRELTAAADPHIAGAIGHRGVEERDIRADRRQQDDRVARCREGIVDDAPIRSMGDEIGADEAPQGHEGNALLCRL